MKTHYTLKHWTIVVLVSLLGVLSVRAESDIETVTKALKSNGIAGVASLIEKGNLEVPRIGSGDSFQPDQTALVFGRELLRQVNATMEVGGTTPDMIESLLVIGQWLRGEAEYGNLIISHRVFDVAGGLALKTLALETPPSKEVIDLAKRVAETTMEPTYRARVLDKEPGTQLFGEQLSAIGPDAREQTIRKLWKNLCFLGYSEANPKIIGDLGQAKQSIVQSLGKKSEAFISLAKTVPRHLVAPQTLQFASTELLEARNLWFVALVSSPENRRSVEFVIDYYLAARRLPTLNAGIAPEEGRRVFAEMLTDANPSANPTIANRAVDVLFSVKAGVPIDGDSSIRAIEKP